MEHLPRGDRQPYTTVLGLLQGMEKAGLVDHEKLRASPTAIDRRLAREGTGQPALRFPDEVLPWIGRAVGARAGRRPELAPDDLRAIEARLAANRDGAARGESKSAGPDIREKRRCA